ncbi:MAG: Nif3-like dinuclear metal center hexameric protein [Bacteroidetes bacterium GWF2_38_335]|nr:MAG: Nif3-like dinuclear metal center hexameric protein [Bacteroidetes bacterium GWF2_38_335]OFY80105.1 MAG: Nif3-like dinuclear metal center hexameric protein [Bacteroidetes bacterium RIFOXYA12_FULL_38_20]HBS88569.1 Nif3-like dinuclear metal center hexameric protein [Bacteroidales bacterium]
MKLKEIISVFEKEAPLAWQESYDNSGLQTGDENTEIKSALLTIDVTEEVVDEAIKKKSNLIICHHPVIFGGIKKLTTKTPVERILRKAIQKDIAIYAAHTNLDNIKNGVNSKICDKLGLKNRKILSPVKNSLKKIVVFVPETHADKVRKAICDAGAGHIGNYDFCSFNVQGTGTFRGSEETNPFVGEKGKIHFEKEIRIETIIPSFLQNSVVNAMKSAHPYEEVAYDIYPIENKNEEIGAGMTGELEKEIETLKFFNFIKKTFGVKSIRHTEITKNKIKKIAVCGGSGSFLIRDAISSGADIFITGDVKYHQFFDAENRIIIADIGHFESERFTNEIFYDLLTKKFPKFAVNFSETSTNPIYYY